MLRRTFTGSLVAASLTAGALMSLPAATAAPTFVSGANISGSGALPTDATVAMAENGAAAAAWIRSGRVVAATSVGGSWTAPSYVSAPGAVVADPVVAMNDQGESVVAWSQVDGANDVRVAMSRTGHDAYFDAPALVSPSATFDVKGPIDLAVDGTGRAFASYRISDNGSFNQVRVTRWAANGGATTNVISDTSAFNNSIAVNSSGQALVAYYDDLAVDSVVNTRRYDPATSQWGTVRSVGLVGTYGGGRIATSLSDTGSGTVAYTKQDLDGDYRAMVNTSKANGTLGGAGFASAAGYSATNLNLDENDKGAALLAYVRVGNGNYLGYTQRSEAGNWTSPAIVNAALNSLAVPRAAISDSGFAFVGWDDDGRQKAAYRAAIYQGMTGYDSGASKWVGGETGVGIDDQGNVLLAGVLASNDPANGIVSGKFLDTAGPTSSMSAPTTATTIGTVITVSRSATDRFSNEGKGSFRVRSASWKGTFGSPQVFASDTSATTVAYVGQPGRTYCFSSRAVDSHANVGAWSKERCTTTPVDDRAGVIAKGFKRATAGTAYRGTYSVAKKKYAVMSFQHVKASRIAVLVSKLPKGGKIQVRFAGKTIGTYSLKGSGTKKLVAAKSFGTVKTGTLVIKVVSKTGKVVRIDGLVVAK